MILLSDVGRWGGTTSKVLSQGLERTRFSERPLAAAWERGGASAEPEHHPTPKRPLLRSRCPVTLLDQVDAPSFSVGPGSVGGGQAGM